MHLNLVLSIILSILKEIPILYLMIFSIIQGYSQVFLIIVISAFLLKKIIYSFSDNYIILNIIREIPIFLLAILLPFNYYSINLGIKAMIAFWVEDVSEYIIEGLILNYILSEYPEDIEDFFK